MNINKKKLEQYSNFGNNIGAVSDVAGNLANTINSMVGGKDPHSGLKGNVRTGIEQGWNSVADFAGNFGPYGKLVQGGLKAINAINSIQNAALGSAALDNMTTTDAILSSPLGMLVPGLGLVNALGGKNADTITKNEEVFAKVGSANGGTSAAVDEALNFSGKRYGLLSGGARKDANFGIAQARMWQNQIETQADVATTRKDLVSSMSGINSNRRAFDLQGGWNNSIHVGKQGMVLEKKIEVLSELELPTIKEFKQGGTVSLSELELPTVLSELSLEDVIKFAKGGIISDDVTTRDKNWEYIYERFPILKKLDNIELYYDKEFTPEEGSLEYIQSKYDDIPYYIKDEKPYQKPIKGKSVVVYNDNAIPEDLALDVLSHGMREYDSNYLTLVDNLLDNDLFYQEVFNQGFPIFSKIPYSKYKKLSDKQKSSLLRKFEKSEEFESIVDGLIRALLVKDEFAKKLRYNYSPKFIDTLKSSDEWKELENYIFPMQVDSFKEGGQFNVIPEGALHARLHHMENNENITKKGIPVVSEDENGNLEQHAEIERAEIILRLELTKKLEELYNKYNNSEYTQSEKDKFAIEAGKLLTDEILNNTIDNTNNLL